MFYSALEAELILELCHTFVCQTRQQQQQQTEMITNIRKGKVRKHSMSRYSILLASEGIMGVWWESRVIAICSDAPDI